MRSIRTALIALPLLSALLFAAPAAADVKDGVDAWQNGDYHQAVTEWRPLALAGDPDAQFNLGQAYKLGRGVSADLSQAEGWYRRAAKQGHLQAEDNLGLILFTANRRDEAMPYIIASAARGEPRAQYVLGTAMFNGDLATKDWPRAYALTKRASDAGLDVASARLAQLDRLIPLETRQVGLAMLPQIEKDEQRARLAAVSASAPSQTAPPPSAIKVASVPVSGPGARYAPPPAIASTPAPAKPTPAAAAATKAAVEATAAAKAATAAAPEDGAKAVIKPAPKAVPAKAAPAVKPAVDGPWRAQLGAFGVASNAGKLWSSLGKKYPAVAARQPYMVKAGSVTRLQAGGFASRNEAESFCSKLRSGGQTCVAVPR